ncbi:RNA polymerase sigma-70 factor [Chitinophaga sp. MM2321]|uniref:RNA polymerase sigma factor n=1 Tax=Chitinophaga sp. MM2321 TaxID=3137178 RepID=UPI0032D571CA
MSSYQQYEESTLLALLAEDSEYAFQLIFDRYRNHVYKVAVVYLKSPAIAEEIVQDIFLKLWFQRKELTGIHSLEAWLYTVTKNFVLNAIKKTAHEWTARERWLKETQVDEGNADEKVITEQYRQLLAEAIAQLPKQQQLVYKLGKEQYLSYEEIAQRLSLSPLTVKTHMARALDAIRTFLRQNGVVFVILLLIGKK